MKSPYDTFSRRLRLSRLGALALATLLTTHATAEVILINVFEVSEISHMEEMPSAEEPHLRDWFPIKDLTPTGRAEVAGYNPPWTLPPYRRNEVLIPVGTD